MPSASQLRRAAKDKEDFEKRQADAEALRVKQQEQAAANRGEDIEQFRELQPIRDLARHFGTPDKYRPKQKLAEHRPRRG